MHLTPDSLLFGVSPAILIDCAQQLHIANRPCSFSDFCTALGAPEAEAKPVLEQMTAAGFMDTGEPPEQLFLPTEKLSQLALASISGGIARKEADKLLQTVLLKIDEVNANPEEFPYVVECLVVFGSYLGTKPVLGDLDLGVELREPPRTRAKGKPVEEMLRDHYSGWNKSAAALRLRKPKLISIHRLEEVVRLGTPYKVIWGHLPDMNSDAVSSEVNRQSRSQTGIRIGVRQRQ